MFAASKTKQVSSAAVFVEDVMSTYVYTGTGSDQTLTTGVDLSTYGGMIWSKRRSAVENHFLQDTNRGLASRISSNTTGAAATTGAWPMNAISTTGMTVSGVNYAAGGETYVSWTFRKQPKFFDVVTYTGDGASSKTIAHSLGSTPGCIIVKRTSGTSGWQVFHRSLGNTDAVSLNNTNPTGADVGYWNNTSPTATDFTIGSFINGSGSTYVAYLFAHNAGGFGLTGTDNVISCGSFTVNGSGDCSVSLGYEPQWLMVKSSTAADNWYLYDNMRGFPVAPADGELLRPNTSQAGITASTFRPTSTGFVGSPGTGFGTGIYIAIRRGPMKTPTSGTSVYESTTSPASGSPGFTAGFPVDFAWLKRPAFTGSNFWGSRLTGAAYLDTTDTAAEQASGNWTWDYQSGWFATGLGSTYRSWMIRRAPGFFDVVCYTGDNVSGRTVQHNLGTAPDLVFVKCRSTGPLDWYAYGRTGNTNQLAGSLNNTWAFSSFAGFSGFTQQPTSQYLYLSSGADETNGSGKTYVAYLFGSVAGVSKVGSYSGTGATQTISCGFAARFVLIKRTDSTGNWVVWDTSRGMVAGTDPRLELNTTNAETNANWVYTDASGFQIVTTDATVNASGGSYIFWAVA